MPSINPDTWQELVRSGRLWPLASRASSAQKGYDPTGAPQGLAIPSHPFQEDKKQPNPLTILPSEDLLIVSPYPSKFHLLDLRTIGQPQRILAKALTLMESSRDDYATAPYSEAFNWDFIVTAVKALAQNESFTWTHQIFYIVVFRSQIPLTTDRSHLGALDKSSHAEAMESGGLLKYWFGIPDVNGRNMATCVWREREDASRGSIGVGHKEAMRATIDMYTEWKLERLKLVIGDDVEEWGILNWEG